MALTDPDKPARLWFVAAAIIVKDEASHIEEWLNYHHLLGVEHFYLYDNGSSDNIREVLAPYITRGLVTYIFWPHFPGQFDAYAHACQMAAPFAEWLCLFDADEFLALKEVDDLHAYLAGLDADQVLIRWRMFGHSGHRQRPDGLVVENYVRCATQVHHVVKAIVRPAAVKRASVHFSQTLTRRSVTVDGEPVREGWAVRQAPGPQLLELNHYYTRSYDEYVAKMSRGDANRGEPRPIESFERWDCPREDRSLAAFAPAIRARVAAIRGLPASPLRSASLAKGRIATASPTFGIIIDGLLADLQALAGAEGAAPGAITKGKDGSSLVIPDPSGPVTERLRAELRRRFGAIAAENGIVTLGTIDGTDEPGRERASLNGLARFALPGYSFALFAFGPSSVARTFRFRVVGAQGGREVQFFEAVSAAAGTLVIAARMIGAPCQPTDVEVRKVDGGAGGVGPIVAHFGLIA